MYFELLGRVVNGSLISRGLVDGSQKARRDQVTPNYYHRNTI